VYNLKPREYALNSLLELLSNSERMDDALLILSTMFKIGYGLGSLACTIRVDKLCTGTQAVYLILLRWRILW
jgi:hypothetical protein